MNATSPPPSDRHARLFPFRASPREASRIGSILRKETVGGALLVGAVVVALIWANSPWAAGYEALRDIELGFAPWHLRLSLEAWAADGLLAVFFFLVGLELKREFVAGDLRRFGTAIIPIAAAAGGVAVPALIYTAIAAHDPALRGGWAIPTATDIAFAVAVLALIGSRLPSSLRIFLLTLAVVDDLIAVAIIAIFYTDSIHPVPLLAAVITIVGYGALAQLGRRFFAARPAAAWLILLPIGAVAWAFMHASGIHATIAGVLLGFTVPVLHRRRDRDRDGEDGPGLAERFEHRFRPLSAGIAVPLFAFFSAGVAIGGAKGFAAALGSPLTLGVMAALVIGKPVGIVVTTWLLTRLERVRLDPALRWVDIVGVGLLGGIGFTVALLVDDLSFASGSPENAHAKVAIFAASILSAILASIVLGSRNRRYRRAEDHEDGDAARGGSE
ncbi:Na+/H+ antiporter NhaA [Gryllotalpicola koreensis]|uniref:Na(+)/H(+) antiporter NhaA n=1 Tax=Gryllotalpicola koreensis TaxID=993086 RepID=A0ABP7ZRJ3_9MICO